VTALRAAGDTHVGAVRVDNEDTHILDPGLGLYAVFDGMGGASAGDVAAQLARDVVMAAVQARPRAPARELLDAALNEASARIFAHAASAPTLRGMGTTAVVALHRERVVTIAHVGDSRAYLWRDGRLLALTADHALVAELVARGVLSAEEAEVHPYRSVLSRNLGAMATCKVDVVDVELAAGDRLLLCSDGLTGYAPTDAIAQVLSSGDAPARITHGLIDLALRGGGGDNVTVVVLEAAGVAATATAVLRTSGATAWWQRRAVFQAAIVERGLPASPVVASLGPAAARQLLAEHVAQAVFHDLERTTAVNTWTFATTLAAGWMRGARAPARAWPPLRDVLDGIAACGQRVVEALRGQDAELADLLEVAVRRLWAVADLAVATVMAEQVRLLDAELAATPGTSVEATAPTRRDSSSMIGSGSEPATFVEQVTVPFVRGARLITADAGGPEQRGAVAGVLRSALQAAAAEQAGAPVVAGLRALELIAFAEDTAAIAAAAARDLFGVRVIDHHGMAPLYELGPALARLVRGGVEQLHASAAVRASTARRLAIAQQQLATGVAMLIAETTVPISQRVGELTARRDDLLARLARGDRELERLERAHATVVDRTPPGGGA
jgi:serine/threonine protein phosphatase PrpC